MTSAQFSSDLFLQKLSYSMFASLAKPDDNTELHRVKVHCLFLPRAPLFFLLFLPCPHYSHHHTSASEASPLQYIAPFSRMCHGWMATMASTVSTLMLCVRTLYLYLPQAALIVYDDLSKQAVAYRQISLRRRCLPLSYFIDLVKIVRFAGSLKLYLAHYREAATIPQFVPAKAILLHVCQSCEAWRWHGVAPNEGALSFFTACPSYHFCLAPPPPLFTSSYFCLILAARSGHRDSPPSQVDSSMWNVPILTCSFSSTRCTMGSVVSSLYHFKDSEQRCWLLCLSRSQRASSGFISPRA